MTDGTGGARARQVAPSHPTCSRAPSTICARAAAIPSRGALLVEVLDELALVDRSVGVVGHGCYTQIITTADVEFLQCLHGRAPSVATGDEAHAARTALIYTLQGDGDMVSEGLAEVLHTAARGESITVPAARQRRVRRHRWADDRDHHRRAAHQDRPRRAAAPAQYGYPIPIADVVAQFPGSRLRRARRGRPAQRRGADPAVPARGVRVADGGRGLLARRDPHDVPDGLVGPGRPGRRVPARADDEHLPAGRAARTLTGGRPDPRHPHAPWPRSRPRGAR